MPILLGGRIGFGRPGVSFPHRIAVGTILKFVLLALAHRVIVQIFRVERDWLKDLRPLPRRLSATGVRVALGPLLPAPRIVTRLVFYLERRHDLLDEVPLLAYFHRPSFVLRWGEETLLELAYNGLQIEHLGMCRRWSKICPRAPRGKNIVGVAVTASVRGFHCIRPYRADRIAGRIIATLLNPTSPRYPWVISYSFALLFLSLHTSVLFVQLRQKSKFSSLFFSLFFENKRQI